MKNKITFTLLLVPIFLLSACGATRPNTTSTAQGTADVQRMPLATKLAIGTLKLDGTASAITPKQAVELLPLWQVYQQISISDTAAQEEISALTDQIQETMTPDQMKTINNLNLSQQDVFAFMQEKGIVQANNNTAQQGTGRQNNGFPNGGFQQGQGGPGFFPGGGFGGGGQSQNFSPQQIATAQARRSQNGGGGNFRFNRTPTALIEAVIKMLQGLVHS